MRSGLDASRGRAVATEVCGATAMRPLTPREIALKELYRTITVWPKMVCPLHVDRCISISPCLNRSVMRAPVLTLMLCCAHATARNLLVEPRSHCRSAPQTRSRVYAADHVFSLSQLHFSAWICHLSRRASALAMTSCADVSSAGRPQEVKFKDGTSQAVHYSDQTNCRGRGVVTCVPASRHAGSRWPRTMRSRQRPQMSRT